MPRMYFHLYECGSVTTDDDGRDMPDLEVARIKATEAAREIMCAEVAKGNLCLSCHIEIVDERGDRLMLLPFKDMIEVTGL